MKRKYVVDNLHAKTSQLDMRNHVRNHVRNHMRNDHNNVITEDNDNLTDEATQGNKSNANETIDESSQHENSREDTSQGILDLSQVACSQG